MNGSEALLSGVELLARSGRAIEIRLRGTSMGSSLASGSLVHIEPSRLEALSTGDVVAFRDGDRLVAHRIAYIGRRQASRCFAVPIGDAYSFPDRPVNETEILGRVTEYHDGLTWKQITAMPSRTRAGRVIARLSVIVVAAALEIHPHFAKLMAGALIAARSFLHSGRTSKA